MTSTPFIDGLTKQQKEFVAKNVQKNRPKYFSATLAATKSQTQRTRADTKEFDPYVKISEDLEAFLILLPSSFKETLLGVVNKMSVLALPTDETELMKQVVETRVNSYSQLVKDCRDLSKDYEQVYGKTVGEIQRLAPVEGDENTAVLIPDLSRLFNAANASILDFTKPEVVGVHDRITDQLVLLSYTDASSSWREELSSWANVIRAYMSPTGVPPPVVRA